MDGTTNMYGNCSCTCNVTDNGVNGGMFDGGDDGDGGFYLKRAHGCMMITAWVLFSALGIFMPRYFRQSFGDRKILSTELWFTLHRMFMVMTLLCTAIGFILIFVVNDGTYMAFPTPEYPAYFAAHAPIGIVVMILVILNPVMALFRCSPDHNWRPLFNWVHLLVGCSTQILAFITMLIGLQIAAFETVLQTTAVFWILVSFVALHLLMEFVINKASISALTNSNIWIPGVTKSQNSEKSYRLSYMITQIFYAVAVLGLWITMMVLIGLGI